MVTAINFLPWREQQQLYQEKESKKVIFTSMLMTLLMLFCLHFLMMTHIHHLNERIVELKNRLHDLREKEPNTARIDFLTQGKTIKNAQYYQEITQQIFLALTKKTPAVLCFTEIRRVKNNISFSGMAGSMADLTFFLQQAFLMNFFSEIKLTEIEQQSNSQKVKFKLDAREFYFPPFLTKEI